MSASTLPQILVSLPVHEEPAVVRDQIANIQNNYYMEIFNVY
jgi:hypothetical protein